jgi:hypothetical protein
VCLSPGLTRFNPVEKFVSFLWNLIPPAI